MVGQRGNVSADFFVSETLPAPPPPAINGIAALDPREALARQMMPEAPNAAHRRQLELMGRHGEHRRRSRGCRSTRNTGAARVKSDFDIDDNSRSDWKDKVPQVAGLRAPDRPAEDLPTGPNASNIIYPLMTTAAIQFAARAYPAIIRDRNVVKGTVIGNDDGIPNPAFAAAVQQMQQQLQGQPPSPQALAHLPQQWQVEPGRQAETRPVDRPSHVLATAQRAGGMGAADRHAADRAADRGDDVS